MILWNFYRHNPKYSFTWESVLVCISSLMNSIFIIYIIFSNILYKMQLVPSKVGEKYPSWHWQAYIWLGVTDPVHIELFPHWFAHCRTKMAKYKMRFYIITGHNKETNLFLGTWARRSKRWSAAIKGLWSMTRDIHNFST